MHSSKIIGTLIFAAMSAGGLAANCLAQEIAAIDLTKVAARMDLRRPAQNPRARQGVGDSREISDCSDFTSRRGRLRTTLVSLDRTSYQIGGEPTFEVTVENAGSEPLKVPFSPHLSDLQPADPGKQFGYFELAVVLWIGGKKWSSNTGGVVALYGAADHSSTLLTLQPGEWVRIVGKGQIRLPNEDDDVIKLITLGDVVDHANARAYLSSNETLVGPEGGATVSREICLDEIQGVAVPITVVAPNLGDSQ